jgi:hypothetical protein
MRTRTSTTGTPPLLAEFLEEQLWALRDRIEALAAVSLREPLVIQLAVLSDELTDVALLLRRPTRTNRNGVTVLLAQMRRTLETLERQAWPARAAGR